MAAIQITADNGQIRLEGDLPPESMLMLLTQAVEMVRVQVVAKAVADLPPSITLASPNGIQPGSHGLRGGDANFRIGRAPSGG